MEFVKDLKSLKALLKLCREQGVQEIELGAIKFKLGDIPHVQAQSSERALTEEVQDPYSNFPVGELTPDQLMFYSAGGKPEDDPENQGS